MEQESSTAESGGESTLDRLEAMLSADDAPDTPSTPPEAQADAPAATPEKADVPEAESEQPEYQLSDVAKLLGADESALDVDEDGNILVKTKIEGQEGRAKFADLLKSYQLQGYADKQVREAAEIRKAAIEQSQAIQQQIQVQQAVIGKIAEAKAMENELAQYQNINWNALIDSDPVQAVKLDRQMRDLQQAYANKTNEINQAANYVQQQSAQQTEASLQQERQALARAIPEWSSEATATKEKQAIAADLKARGYSERDIQGLSDHKAVLLARDAMLYRQLKGSTATKEQVRQAPRIVQPGSPSNAPRGAKAIQNLKTEVRRSGSKQSVMDYLLATGKA